MSRLVVVSDFHASKRRPKLEEITIAWRGGYGYVTGHLPGEEQLPLCRAALSRPGHRLGLRALPEPAAKPTTTLCYPTVEPVGDDAPAAAGRDGVAVTLLTLSTTSQVDHSGETTKD